MDIALIGEGPLFRRLHSGLKRAIRELRFAPGAKLPGTRSLSRSLGVSRNVVLMAFGQLEAEGLIEPRRGAGSFVTGADTAPPRFRQIAKAAPIELSKYGQRADRLHAQAAYAGEAAPLRFDFQYRFTEPDRTSLSHWARLARGQLRRSSFDYADPFGLFGLREAIAQRLKRVRAIDADPANILIVAGSQQGLDIAARALIDPGDRVLIEEPHYQGARQAFLAAGATLATLAADAKQARLAYVTPTRQFPTGTAWPLQRKVEFLRWCRGRNVVALEDDYDTEYRFGAVPAESLLALDPEAPAIHLSSFAKTISPSLRIGYLILPKQLVSAFGSAKWIADRGNAPFEQGVLEAFIRDGCYDGHLRRMARGYARKRELLIECLESRFGSEIEISPSLAGTEFVAWFPALRFAQTEILIGEARALEVGVYSIEEYYLRAPKRCGVVMGFATMSDAQIRSGVLLLARAYERVVRQRAM